MKFRTKLFLAGKTATGIEVPEKTVAALGTAKRPAVKVTINGYTYRSTVAVMGGKFLLPVSAEVREKAAVAAGEDVEVDIELDTEPRELAIPDDFAKALAKDKEAKKFFETLSYSKKRAFILPIDGAKTAETRERRIAKSVAALQAGRSTP